MESGHGWYERHRFAVNTAVYVALVAVALVAGAGNANAVWVRWPWLGWPLLVAGQLVQLWLLWHRRERPFTYALVSLACLVLVGDTSHVSGALFALALRRRGWATVGVGVLGALAVASPAAWITPDVTLNGEPLQNPSTALLVISWALVAVMAVAIPMLFGAFLGARRDLVASLKDRAQRAEVEQELRAEQARLNERSRIAREMHDVLGHRLALIAMQAGGLEVNAGGGPDLVERQAAAIGDSARAAMEDLREVLGVLTIAPAGGAPEGAEMAPQPGLADIAGLVAASRAAGARIVVTNGLPEGAEAPPTVSRTAYRVAQEALTNAHKHAPGAEVTLALDGAPGRDLEVRVRNRRSAGAGTAPGAGSGLTAMAERVRLAGGTLSAATDDDGGFTVHARLPWAVAS